MRFHQPQNRIEKVVGNVGIADEDVDSWLEFLKSSGYTQKEIDEIVGGLNISYQEKVMDPTDKRLLDALVRSAQRWHGERMLSPEDRKHHIESLGRLKRAIASARQGGDPMDIEEVIQSFESDEDLR